SSNRLHLFAREINRTLVQPATSPLLLFSLRPGGGRPDPPPVASFAAARHATVGAPSRPRSQRWKRLAPPHAAGPYAAAVMGGNSFEISCLAAPRLLSRNSSLIASPSACTKVVSVSPMSPRN